MHFTAKLNIPQLRTSTQVIFLICGLGISSWAPMVPYAKDQLKLNEAGMGSLLLFLGAGALIMMPVTGWLITKLGSRKVILYATFVTAGCLPLLLAMNTSVSLALILFVFGSGVGSVDVAMNAHGVQVQNISGKPIMSSLHGLFSVGGLLGSLGIGFLTRYGLNPIWAASCISGILIILVLLRYNSLLDKDSENELVLRVMNQGIPG
jgi:MFS family permease